MLLAFHSVWPPKLLGNAHQKTLAADSEPISYLCACLVCFEHINLFLNATYHLLLDSVLSRLIGT